MVRWSLVGEDYEEDIDSPPMVSEDDDERHADSIDAGSFGLNMLS